MNGLTAVQLSLFSLKGPGLGRCRCLLFWKWGAILSGARTETGQGRGAGCLLAAEQPQLPARFQHLFGPRAGVTAAECCWPHSSHRTPATPTRSRLLPLLTVTAASQPCQHAGWVLHSVLPSWCHLEPVGHSEVLLLWPTTRCPLLRGGHPWGGRCRHSHPRSP